MNDLLRSIPLDKYLHLIGSIIIFAALRPVTSIWDAAAIATAAHVAKKAYDYSQGLRDWKDLIGDVVAGAIGALLAVACAL
jgi:hypothetical protein